MYNLLIKKLSIKIETDKILYYSIPIIVLLISILNIILRNIFPYIVFDSTISTMKSYTSVLFILFYLSVFLNLKIKSIYSFFLFYVFIILSFLIQFFKLDFSIESFNLVDKYSIDTNTGYLALILFLLLGILYFKYNKLCLIFSFFIMAIIFIGYIVNIPVLFGYVENFSNAVSVHTLILFIHCYTWILINNNLDIKKIYKGNF